MEGVLVHELDGIVEVVMMDIYWKVYKEVKGKVY